MPKNKGSKKGPKKKKTPKKKGGRGAKKVKKQQDERFDFYEITFDSGQKVYHVVDHQKPDATAVVGVEVAESADPQIKPIDQVVEQEYVRVTRGVSSLSPDEMETIASEATNRAAVAYAAFRHTLPGGTRLKKLEYWVASTIARRMGLEDLDDRLHNRRFIPDDVGFSDELVPDTEYKSRFQAAAHAVYDALAEAYVAEAVGVVGDAALVKYPTLVSWAKGKVNLMDNKEILKALAAISDDEEIAEMRDAFCNPEDDNDRHRQITDSYDLVHNLGLRISALQRSVINRLGHVANAKIRDGLDILRCVELVKKEAAASEGGVDGTISPEGGPVTITSEEHRSGEAKIAGKYADLSDEERAIIDYVKAKVDVTPELSALMKRWEGEEFVTRARVKRIRKISKDKYDLGVTRQKKDESNPNKYRLWKQKKPKTKVELTESKKDLLQDHNVLTGVVDELLFVYLSRGNLGLDARTIGKTMQLITRAVYYNFGSRNRLDKRTMKMLSDPEEGIQAALPQMFGCDLDAVVRYAGVFRNDILSGKMDELLGFERGQMDNIVATAVRLRNAVPVAFWETETLALDYAQEQVGQALSSARRALRRSLRGRPPKVGSRARRAEREKKERREALLEEAKSYGVGGERERTLAYFVLSLPSNAPHWFQNKLSEAKAYIDGMTDPRVVSLRERADAVRGALGGASALFGMLGVGGQMLGDMMETTHATELLNAVLTTTQDPGLGKINNELALLGAVTNVSEILLRNGTHVYTLMDEPRFVRPLVYALEGTSDSPISRPALVAMLGRYDVGFDTNVLHPGNFTAHGYGSGSAACVQAISDIQEYSAEAGVSGQAQDPNPFSPNGVVGSRSTNPFGTFGTLFGGGGNSWL